MGLCLAKGPFEILDALGPKKVIEKCNNLGIKLPRMLEVINNSTKDTFYSTNSEFLNINGDYEKNYRCIMKIFILLKILIILLNFQNFLFAGAPPLNKEMLPTAPYSFIKTNHVIVGVEWEKSSLKEIIPLKLLDTSKITGGINIFNSRKKQTFSPVSGKSYGWVDIPAGNKKEKFIIFSIYGPNDKINKVMNSVYNLKSDVGSNKVTLINNKAIATSSIRGKKCIIFSALNIENV